MSDPLKMPEPSPRRIRPKPRRRTAGLSAGLTSALCLGLLMLSGCDGSAGLTGQGAKAERVDYTGYAEGLYHRAAAREGGQIARIFVQEGEQVTAGAALFALEPDRITEASGASEAAARAARVRAGAQAEAALARVRSDADLAQKAFARTEALFRQGLVPQSRLDADRARLDQARALVRQAEAEQSVGGLEAEAKSSQARLDQTRAAQMTVYASVSGEVARLYYRDGEVIAAGAPVVSLLPDTGRRIRFFVPEADLSTLAPGTRLSVRCSGCPKGGGATVRYVASEPQYTPPVLYGRDARHRLVWMAEADPDPGLRLRPGQPLDLTRMASPSQSAPRPRVPQRMATEKAGHG